MRLGFRWLQVLACLVLVSARGFEPGRGPTVQKGIVYSTADGVELKLDLVRPAGDGPFPLVLWIHGGAWQIGDRKDHMGAMLALAQKGYAGASIDYRLTPKHKWPAQLEDCRAALAFLRGKAGEYRIDPDRVGAAGASAGGHLALILGLAPHPGKPAGIKAVVNIFGPTDLRTFAPSESGDAVLCRVLGKDMNALLVDFLGTSDSRARIMAEASPLTYVARDNPPVLTLHGSADLLCPVAQAKALHEALHKAGVTEKLVVVEGAGHDPNWPADKRDMVNRAMVEFLDQHVKRQAK
jgi:acetyl esterase/lipase